MAFLFLYWNNRNNLLAFTLSKTPGLVLEWGNSVSKHNYPPTLITQRGQEVSSHRIITRSQLPRVIQTMSGWPHGGLPRLLVTARADGWSGLPSVSCSLRVHGECPWYHIVLCAHYYPRLCALLLSSSMVDTLWVRGLVIDNSSQPGQASSGLWLRLRYSW